MKKFLLSLAAVLGLGISANAGQLDLPIVGADYWPGVSAYNQSITSLDTDKALAATGGVQWVLANFNNNNFNNNWTYIKVGGKNTTTSGILTNKSALSLKVSKVTISCSGIANGKVNSLTVKVSSDDQFADATTTSYTYSGELTKPSSGSTVDWEVEIPTPAADMFYQVDLNVTNTSTRTNGVATITNIKFDYEDPVITVSGYDAEAGTVQAGEALTFACEGAYAIAFEYEVINPNAGDDDILMNDDVESEPAEGDAEGDAEEEEPVGPFYEIYAGIAEDGAITFTIPAHLGNQQFHIVNVYAFLTEEDYNAWNNREGEYSAVTLALDVALDILPPAIQDPVITPESGAEIMAGLGGLQIECKYAGAVILSYVLIDPEAPGDYDEGLAEGEEGEGSEGEEGGEETTYPSFADGDIDTGLGMIAHLVEIDPWGYVGEWAIPDEFAGKKLQILGAYAIRSAENADAIVRAMLDPYFVAPEEPAVFPLGLTYDIIEKYMGELTITLPQAFNPGSSITFECENVGAFVVSYMANAVAGDVETLAEGDDVDDPIGTDTLPMMVLDTWGTGSASWTFSLEDLNTNYVILGVHGFYDAAQAYAMVDNEPVTEDPVVLYNSEDDPDGPISFKVVSEETGLNSIEAQGAAAVYYNLQGVRVANPTNGLYIKRQGNKVSKVIL